MVKDADEIIVRLIDQREKPARVVGADKRSDTALLKIDAEGGLPTVEIGLERPTGALVARVVPDGPASKADLKVGDVIPAYDGTPVETSAELPPMVGVAPVGETVSIKIQRDAKVKILTVTVEALSEEKPSQTIAKTDAHLLNMAVADLTQAQREELDIGDRGVLSRKWRKDPPWMPEYVRVMYSSCSTDKT